MDPTAEFWHRLHTDWLPTFCNCRGYPLTSFRDSKKVSPRDAADFLRALSFITVNERGQFTMPCSKAKEVIFWDGGFSDPNVRMTLWIEPVVTIAAIARLHLDYGWPTECLGMQSSKWEFDLTAFLPGSLEHEHIAGEVKATSKDLDVLIRGMEQCCERGSHDCASEKPPQRNAHQKWSGLLRSRAPVFWTLGPDRDSRVFRVHYEADDRVRLRPAEENALRFPE